MTEEFEFYYDNGQLFYKGDYKNGKKDGPWVIYWSNGQLHYKGDYRNGKKEGTYVFFNRDGSKYLWSGVYRNGKKVYYVEEN